MCIRDREWAYRFLGAALAELADHPEADRRAAALAAGPALELWAARRVEPTPAVVRAWAVANAHPVSDRGRVPADVRQAYAAAHPEPTDHSATGRETPDRAR